MTISYRWLLDYLPGPEAGFAEPISPAELSNILTSIGLEVEALETAETVKGGLEGLVIGEVLTCARHPNADKLSVTTVAHGGGEPWQIVCGAPNVAAGQKVVVAPVGATVHPLEGEPFLIKKAKIRGEESAGMICAEDEIGLGKSHAGIMVLPADAPVGMSAREYFKLPPADIAVHIGLTPNRSDANSHIGVARDVCAYLSHHKGGTYRPVMPKVADLRGAGEGTSVKVEATDACPRYTGLNIRGIKVGPSPEWLKLKLQTIGVRSINNVVDITNYVLHEYGQPLHAFDADKLKGGIIVKHLPEGTVFTGLDDKERKLRAEDLVICDAEGPVAIGGVFGGNHSGITESTTNVFLESAYFAPMSVRRTSMHHGLRTDAATHFEKGVDINNVLPALRRAAAMITEIAGGEVSSAIVDVYPQPMEDKVVRVTCDYIRGLAGKDYSNDAIKNVLVALGFEVLEDNSGTLSLKVPTNKADVHQPADIVEEVLRIDGLDNVVIPSRLNISLIGKKQDDRGMRERLAELLCGMGVQEIVTNSIVNSKYYPGNESLVKMINSLSSELDTMRPSMLESGLEVVQYNCNRKNQSLALFEFGNVYMTVEGKYVQEPRLAIWLTGETHPAQWQHKAQPADIYYIKGLVENLVSYCNIPGVAVAYTDQGGEILWKRKGKVLVRAWRVSKERLNLFDIKQDVFYAEVNWSAWVEAAAAARTRYTEISKFPAVQRDLALVLDKQVTYEQVREVTAKLNLGELQSFGLFDVFESEKLGAGKKSYAMNYTFLLKDRTLTDADTEQLMKKLTEAYKKHLNAQIRE